MRAAIITWLESLPSLAAIGARTSFVPVARISLGNWSELDEATQWCAGQWLERGARYRRHIDVQNEHAVFTFAGDVHAVEFSLRFG